MEETVFFNLGNALASKRDQKELIKKPKLRKILERFQEN